MTTRILVVDDEEHVRALTARALKGGGYECEQACDAAEATQLLQREEFDLTLCDINMPGMSGMDLLRYVSAEHPDTATIMVTGLDDPERAEFAFEIGAYGYMLKPFEQNELLINVRSALRRRHLELELRDHQKLLEERIAEQTESLNETLGRLRDSQSFLQSTLDALSARIAILDEAGRIVAVNAAWKTSRMPGCPFGETLGVGLDYLNFCASPGHQVPDEIREIVPAVREVIAHARNNVVFEYQCCTSGQNQWFTVRITRFEKGPPTRVVVAHEDITELKVLQMNLDQAQKLESVGQLAAGVAHEINTPMQYLGDNIDFLQNKITRLRPLLENYDKVLEVAEQSGEQSELLTETREHLKKLKVKSFLRQVPEAISDSRDGVKHVSRIVRAMKEFSHPGQEERTPVDINRALESTIAVSTNEWKYVAQVETNFDASIPLVPAFPGELNQVFLNILVNAAHAIGDTNDGKATDKGTITVSTQCAGDYVEVSIADSGTGIPDEIKHRIFDPFFTTKEVGKGTGQGLAIAHSVIVQKHGGELRCDSSPGVGTTFFILLPLLPLEPCDNKTNDKLEPAMVSE